MQHGKVLSVCVGGGGMKDPLVCTEVNLINQLSTRSLPPRSLWSNVRYKLASVLVIAIFFSNVEITIIFQYRSVRRQKECLMKYGIEWHGTQGTELKKKKNSFSHTL